MASILKRLRRLLPARTQKGFVGYDLEGNSYFELPSPAGGRMKRTVEYKVNRDLAEYTSGQHRLPVQWTTWLSHTRSDPPSTTELQNDTNRQSNLKPMIEAIEARETAERIRQGYLPDPALAIPESTARRGIAGPSTQRGGQMNTRPSFTTPDTRPGEQTGQSTSTTAKQDQLHPSFAQASAAAQAQAQATGQGRREGSVSERVPAPSQPVDPGRHDDPAELRRLAEEDTKRRIEERGGEADLRTGGGTGKVEGVDVGQGAVAGGLAPRRRGKK